MTAPEPRLINPMELAPIVQAGAFARADTATIWAEIRGWAADQGVRLPSQTWRTVNALRATYAAQRAGTERFSRAAPGDLFTARHAAPELNMRPAEVRDVQPEYLARFRLEYLDQNGDLASRHVTLRDVWAPGMTVGQVRDAIAEAAEGFSMDYGTAYVGHSVQAVVMV